MSKYEYVIYRHSYKIHDGKIKTAPCNKRFSLETIEGCVFAVFSKKWLHIDAEGKLHHTEAYDQENTYALIYGNKLIFSAYCTAEKFKHAVTVGFERDPFFVNQYIRQVMEAYDITKKAA